MGLQCTIEKSEFGFTPKGKRIFAYTLKHVNGITAKIINFGGIINELHVYDAFGNHKNVVLGFNDLGSYLRENIYAGAIVGRVAGRLTNGMFNLHGKSYQLSQNEGPTHLHGGTEGFDKKVWDGSIKKRDNTEVLELTYQSPDGEEGYPGTLNAKVTYSITEAKGLHIHFEATTDRPTLWCPTNHSYFNLAGEGSGDILDHVVQIDSDSIVEVDHNYLPTGRIQNTLPELNDYQEPDFMGKITETEHKDHSHGALYLLKDATGDLKKVAAVHEPDSGISMKVYTNAPCLQLYTGSFLNTTAKGTSGNPYKRYSGFCLECQGFSDAPNHKISKSITLFPGQRFEQSTEYRFETFNKAPHQKRK